MSIAYYNQPQAACRRVWALSQKCEGFSGRTLRRLPILGLAMYTWGGNCTLDDAVTALEAAVDQELLAKQSRAVDIARAGTTSLVVHSTPPDVGNSFW